MNPAAIPQQKVSVDVFMVQWRPNYRAQWRVDGWFVSLELAKARKAFMRVEEREARIIRVAGELVTE